MRNVRSTRWIAGSLPACLGAIAIWIALDSPAPAQFFGFDRPPPVHAQRTSQAPSPFGEFAPFLVPSEQHPTLHPRVRRLRPRIVDYSRAPAPEKSSEKHARNILVIGDEMADWLGYGLEETYAERPEIGIVRKNKPSSGLIRYQSQGQPSEWVSVARDTLLAAKPDAVVVMLGLNDRVSISAKKPNRAAEISGTIDAENPAGGHAADIGTASDDEAAETDNLDDPKAGSAKRPASDPVEFRSDRWASLYAKKIGALIAVLKARGIPVIWVGLPALRGDRGTSDMLFLDGLYRDSAAKAGIIFVDVWDGFVDESGRFALQGPDFEGQKRQLRTGDGVFFTKSGARKLGGYVDREIERLFANRPVVGATQPATPAAPLSAKAHQRPLEGPVVPLVASPVQSQVLCGGRDSAKGLATDELAVRTFRNGTALAAPPGRADDFTWPRREFGRVQDTAALSSEPASTDEVAVGMMKVTHNSAASR